MSGPLTGLPLLGRRMPYVGHEPLRYPAIKLFEKALHLLSGDPVR